MFFELTEGILLILKEIIIIMLSYLISDGEVVVDVIKIIRHESYGRGSYDNDIALLKLAKPVRYNQLIKPICLPQQGKEIAAKKMSYLVGWGRLKEGGKRATVLQEAKVRTSIILNFPTSGYVCVAPWGMRLTVRGIQYMWGGISEYLNRCSVPGGGILSIVGWHLAYTEGDVQYNQRI